jgi:hypothetical protein
MGVHMGFQTEVKSDMSPSTVTVYQVKIYAPTIDEVIISKRYATREGAEMMKGTIIESSAINISVLDLEPGELWTRRGYAPASQ